MHHTNDLGEYLLVDWKPSVVSSKRSFLMSSSFCRPSRASTLANGVMMSHARTSFNPDPVYHFKLVLLNRTVWEPISLKQESLLRR